MDQILEMAKDIGYAIQQDERYIRIQMAQAAADEDEALQEMIGEFNLKRIAINSESTKEDKDDEKLARLNEEMRELYARLMANEHMAAYSAAKNDMDRLIHQIATIVTMAAQGEDPEKVSTENCGGNCASCGGCH